MNANPHTDGAFPGDEAAAVIDGNLIETPAVSGRTFGRAVAWAAGSQILRQAIQLPLMVVLARLLDPRDFGLMAMVMVIGQFVVILVECGFGMALIHRERLEPRHLASAFWLNLALGVVLGAAVAGLAPTISNLYHQPRLTVLLEVVAPNFAIAAVGVVPMALLQRGMRFRSIALVQNLSALLGGISGVTAAVLGAGVWSLVIDYLVVNVVLVTMASKVASWRPRARPDWKGVRELWRYGAGQTGFQATNYWSRNADNLLVGRFLGAVSLGVYDRAYQLMLLPLSQAGYVVSLVLYPTLARIQSDHERLKRAYLRTAGVIALVTFPLSVGIFVTAPDLVIGVFGQQWSRVSDVLRILCLAGLLQSVGSTSGIIYQTQGRTDWLLRWGLASAAVTVGAFFVGLHWGIRGVAASYSIVAIPLAYFNLAVPGRLIDMRFSEVVRAVRAVFGCTMMMGAAVLAVEWALPEELHHLARLAIEAAVAIVVYVGAVSAFHIQPYEALKSLIRTRG